jgi:uncharacterized protein with HEPN domain
MEQEADERSYFALAQIEDFSQVAAQLVGRGRSAYESDPLLRLAGEAIMRRFDDATSRLDATFLAEHPSIRWSDLTMTRNISDGPGGHYDDYWEYLEAGLPTDVPRITQILDAHSRRPRSDPESR